MVKAITFILIFQGLIIVPIMAQHNCNDSVMFGSPEELPVFNKELPCIEKLLEFIAKNIKYPATAQKDKIEGRVYVEFWIDTVGITHGHRVAKGVRQDIDCEALRIAKLIKFDIPAINSGKPVGTCFQVVISFKLANGKDRKPCKSIYRKILK